MPQPLSKLAPDLVPDFGPDAPSRRPELAAEAFLSIHLWSSVDAALGNLLIDLLKADHHATLAVYQTFTSWGQKRQAVMAAAGHSLKPDALNILDAILNAFKTTRDRRNSLAHFIWGWHDDLPNALMCVDPKHIQKQWALT